MFALQLDLFKKYFPVLIGLWKDFGRIYWEKKGKQKLKVFQHIYITILEHLKHYQHMEIYVFLFHFKTLRDCVS